MLHEDVDSDDLIDIHQTTSTRSYLQEIWARRDFLSVVPINDMQVRNMDTLLGQLWLLLTPAMMIAVYYVIFGVILDARRGTGNFWAFLVIGLILFRHSQRTINDATTSIQRNMGLITTIQFPRAMVVFAGVLTQFFAFLPSIAIIVIVLFMTGFTPEVRWLLFPAILGVKLLFDAGASLVAARIGYAVPDVSNVLPHFFRILLYGSGAVFAVDQFIDNSTVVSWLAVNPFYDILAVARWALMDLPISGVQVGGLVAWAVLLPIFGLWWFRRAEGSYTP